MAPPHPPNHKNVGRTPHWLLTGLSKQLSKWEAKAQISCCVFLSSSQSPKFVFHSSCFCHLGRGLGGSRSGSVSCCPRLSCSWFLSPGGDTLSLSWVSRRTSWSGNGGASCLVPRRLPPPAPLPPQPSTRDACFSGALRGSLRPPTWVLPLLTVCADTDALSHSGPTPERGAVRRVRHACA